MKIGGSFSCVIKTTRNCLAPEKADQVTASVAKQFCG